MSLILNRLGDRFITRGLGSTEIDLTEQCEVINIGVINEVIVNKRSYPLTGTYKNVSGWHWNKTKPQELSNVRKRIEHTLGGHASNLEEGSINSDWFGSVLSGLALSQINEIQSGTKRKIWVPKYDTGVYSIFNFDKRLYSNSSTCEILKIEVSSAELGIHSYEPKNKYLEGTIGICLFMRDSNFNNIPAYKYKYDASLTEELSYHIYDGRIEFKNLKEIQVGRPNSNTVEEIQCHFEHLGLGNVNRGVCYTQYFPIEDVTLKTIKNDTVRSWTSVENFEDSNPDDRHYLVDHETGKVVFNSKKVQTLTIKEDKGAWIEVNELIEGLSNRGFLTVNDQEYFYFDRSKHKFYIGDKADPSIERVAEYSPGEIVVSKSSGKRLENMEQIYISYTARPRIDFECLPNKTFYSDLNIKPYTKVDSNGIIELCPQEKHVAKLVLECDKTLIGRSLYGPLFMQGDSSVLTATALNSSDKGVAEVNVRFFGEEGSFEGDVAATQGVQKVSNKRGEARTVYFYPYSNHALSQYSNLHIEGSDSYLIYDNLGIGATVDDIAVFQVYKTDPFKGSSGRRLNVASKKQSNPFGDDFILELEETIGEDYIEYERHQVNRKTDIDRYVKRDLGICDALEWNTGMCIVKFKYMDYTIGPVRIEKVFNNKTIKIVSSSRAQQRVLSNLEIEYITIYKRAELNWAGLGEPAELTEIDKLNRSLNKILYKVDSETGLYKKVIPTKIENNRLYFEGIHLPANSMNDDDNMIAMYKIMAPKDVKLHARCVDPATGYEIRSNEIRLKIDFPNYLKSENGFRFKDEQSQESGGLGGANFIAINPDNYTNQLNLHIIND